MQRILKLEGNEVIISSVIFYNEREQEYYAIEDMIKEIKLPISLKIKLSIRGTYKTLLFYANEIDIYKNNIKTNLS
ncbi:hypothetical protein BAGA_09810 [Bacillus gaemokensis]|uniref:Uncharacterized protein n=1 Tax=Bacillus gaemokensis TaxID=574375 RepID=A0A073JTH3_9BACI|nr:hypothetical protein BAGA_09810 [Bacillus gaemokensis]KYG38455.1 hypothetical protein AZF08_19155 [Bacillus gaemokensis]